MKTTLAVSILTIAGVLLVGYNILTRHQETVHLIHAKIEEEYATQRAQAEVAALVGQLEHGRKRLPGTPDPSWLVTAVVALAEQEHLRFTTINQESPRALQQFTKLAATLEFTASYHQLGSFLDRIERSERFIRVEQLEVTAPRADGEEASIRVTLSTVYLPPVRSGGGA